MKYLLTKSISLVLLVAGILSLSADPFVADEMSADIPELNDELARFKEDPLEINICTLAELQCLPWLNTDQINKIIEYRKKVWISRDQQLIDLGINEITLNEMKDFITYKTRSESHFRNSIRTELHRSKIEKTSCLKIFSKTIISRGGLEAGFISQKDESERDILDFYSYYLLLKHNGILQKAIVGKYQLRTGLGILLSSKLGTAKNNYAAGYQLKSKTQIKPYTSSYEIWDMEGLCAEFKFSTLKFIPFFSLTSLSANLESDRIISFNETGLHIDLNKKNNVKELLFGVLINYETQNFNLGFNYYNQNFDHKFMNPEINNKVSACSFYFDLFRSTLPIQTEIALADGRISLLSNLTVKSGKFRHQLIYRDYQNNFTDWHGKPFAAKGSFPNEKGFYYGITYSPVNQIKFNFYYDLWQCPETGYFEKMPHAGNEILFNCTIKLPEENLLKIQFKQQNKEKYISLKESKIREQQKNNIRLDWIQRSELLKFQTRLEYGSKYLTEEKIYSGGYLFSQLLKFKSEFFTSALQIGCYDSDVLLYLYEYNVDGAMSNAILSGNDIYFNLLISVVPKQFLKLQSNISGTIKNNDKMKICFQIMTSF
jgi:hypothetical protein